jgi:hypothetical protein
MAGKLSGGAIEAGTITTDQLTTSLSETISSGGGPKVTSLIYPDDDTAANTIGGQTVYINGSGFDSNVTVYINNSAVPSVTYINSGNVQITTPNLASGTYPLYVINPEDGGTAIVSPGIVISPEPVWVTGTTLEGFLLSSSVSRNLSATGDGSVTYTLKDGSTLPGGLTLAANGLLSGTITSPPNTSTTYTFTALAIDSENQSTERTFSILGSALTATGGTVSNISGYRVHTFTSTGSLTVTGSGSVEYLVVAGGGGGGAGPYQGGGGGGGGLVEGSVSLSQETYTITIGGGGAASTGTGVRGSNTSISGNDITSIIGIGGGGGAGELPSPGGGAIAGSGGSGGGGSHGSPSPGLAGGAALQPTSESGGYGNDGGFGHSSPGNYVGAGGGGAGAVGGNASSTLAGTGGDGRASSITGSSVTYAGGGGGKKRDGAGAAGGTGGGGTGGSSGGTANLGGGGGYAYSGGSGVVIIRYPV